MGANPSHHRKYETIPAVRVNMAGVHTLIINQVVRDVGLSKVACCMQWVPPVFINFNLRECGSHLLQKF
jgi:hypothetical protein